ncbi:MAG: hypothetical protein ACTHOK_01770, partial [Nocardioidaceae bacterium]
QLAMKARSQPVSTVSFVPPAIDTSHPDVDKIQHMIATAIAKSEAPAGHKKAAPRARRKATGFSTGQAVPGSSVGGSLGNLQQGYAANAASNLSSAC